MSTADENREIPDATWPEVFRRLTLGEDLDDRTAAWAMGEMMSGDATEAQVGAFLLALAAKGETVAELRGLTDAMVARARPVHVQGETLDIVGTGGDRLGTVNLSTIPRSWPPAPGPAWSSTATAGRPRPRALRT